ncbi:MAG TPA: ribosome biogenesis GTP-binding protein YihA/YsxC [Bacteroidia bacterium]
MKISSARFIISNTDIRKCPKPVLPEYAFIGRSNVGKSSLINMLTGQRDLAKTSAKPGKTQLINHFLINEKWYLVDLPGYGYAKVSKEKSALFEKFIADYLTTRTNLLCVFVLVDARLPLQQIDREFFEWCAKKDIPFSIIFTKIDKLKKQELENNLAAFETQMLRFWEEMPATFLTSSEKKLGRDEVLSFIEETNKIFRIV